MNKVVITAPVDYVIGHLRYGHLEGTVELRSEEHTSELQSRI